MIPLFLPNQVTTEEVYLEAVRIRRDKRINAISAGVEVEPE
jgi:hypothetical protein